MDDKLADLSIYDRFAIDEHLMLLIGYLSGIYIRMAVEFKDDTNKFHYNRYKNLAIAILNSRNQVFQLSYEQKKQAIEKYLKELEDLRHSGHSL